MLTDEEVTVIQKSWAEIEGISGGGLFPEVLRRQLIEHRPDLQPLFQSEPSAHQGQLLEFTRRLVSSLRPSGAEPAAPDDDILLQLLALGRRHKELYRVPDDAWDAFGEAWAGALEDLLGPSFRPPVRLAWTKLFTVARNAMQLGGRSSVSLSLGRPR